MAGARPTVDVGSVRRASRAPPYDDMAAMMRPRIDSERPMRPSRIRRTDLRLLPITPATCFATVVTRKGPDMGKLPRTHGMSLTPSTELWGM